MTIYLFALLTITLLMVGVVIDEVTKNALAARELDGAKLIQAQYEERCRVEKDKTDQVLLNQAKILYSLLTEHNGNRLSIEMLNYRILTELAPAMFSTNPLTQGIWSMTAGSPGPNPTKDQLFRMYFANLPLPSEYGAYIQRISETSIETDYQQINAGGGRELHSQSLAGRKLQFDPKDINAKLAENGKASDPSAPFDIVSDDTVLSPGNEPVHRVVLKVPYLGFNSRRGPPGNGPAPGGGQGLGNQQRSLLGSWSVWVSTGFNGPPPPGLAGTRPTGQSIDNLPRLYIQCARPKAAIEAVLAQFAEERDDARATLASDVASTRNKMRLQTVMVGLGALLATLIGGPVIVSAGLRPIGKLSDAVSRVSERNFKLPHDGHNLFRELVPIHTGLTQTLDLLQKAFSREKQAVADISHELRTPIAALMATIDVALRKPRTPEQYRSTLEECRVISKQLGQLVERIMTLATLDAGNDRNMITRTDALDLAAACTALIRPLAAANGITVQLHQPCDMVELDTDPAKLREVLMNLLHNAVEYNRPEGTIDLTLLVEDSHVIFEVQDTGIGMTSEVKDKIFERFFRADPSRHATGVHAGLGLAIVKEYVTRLNGRIEVESEPGVGSTFRIILPALPPEPNVPFEVAESMASRN
jgi:signal transduction histidine kinase